MRFAISTSPQRTTWAWLLDVWRRADALPVFESGWTFDHLYPLAGDSTDDCLEGWVTLTALLQATTRFRGGVLVTGMVYRHPGVLANMASTLDIVSGGRLELGLGAGWNEEECDAFGIELGTLRERFDRFEEGLAVIDSLLTNDRTTFDGSYYHLAEAMNNPKPVQAKIPMCIGGVGRRRTIPLVARHADHWNYGGSDPGEFAELRGRAARGLSLDRPRARRDHVQLPDPLRVRRRPPARQGRGDGSGGRRFGDRLAPEVGAAVGRRACRGGDRLTEPAYGWALGWLFLYSFDSFSSTACAADPGEQWMRGAVRRRG